MIQNKTKIGGFTLFDGMLLYDKLMKLDGFKAFRENTEWKKYYDENVAKKPNSTKLVELGRAARLLDSMVIRGATNSEIERAAKYAIIVFRADKVDCAVDYKKAADDLKIAELLKKYMA